MTPGGRSVDRQCPVLPLASLWGDASLNGRLDVVARLPGVRLLNGKHGEHQWEGSSRLHMIPP
jgi:hypothetical protein